MISLSSFSQGKGSLDSLWGAFRNPGLSDSLRVNAIFNITNRLAHADPDSGLAASRQYVEFVTQKNLGKFKAGAYNVIGTCYLNKGNLDSALAYFTIALSYRREFKDKKGEAIALNNIGIVYYQWGDYYRSLEYYQKSLTIKDSLGDKAGVASSYSNMAMIHEVDGNKKKALVYYRKSLRIRDSLQDLRGMADSYLKLGNYYMHDADYDSSEYFIRRCLHYALAAGDKRTAANAIVNIGHIFKNRNMPDSAIAYFNRAVSMQREINNEEGVATAQEDIGEFYLTQKDYQRARLYCDSAFIASSSLGYIRFMWEACDCLAKAYDGLNQPVLALHYYKLADTLLDSINNVAKAKELSRKALQYEFEMSKLADSLRLQKEAELKDAIHQQDMQKQTFYTQIGIGGFVLMVVIAFILLRGYRLKQSTNRELEKKNILIEEKQKSILDSITYAKRLQEAILPSMETVNHHLPSNFILYKPKDIVAGDFYWLEHVNGITFVAAADCTGHGVPGALVSVVCSTALNRCVLEFGLTDTGKILDRTRELVLETFSKTDKDVKDGMDISLIAIHKDKIQWSGANNPLWLLEGNQIRGIKGDKQPIGKTENTAPFTSHTLQVNKNTRLYLLTDGYADQFGGPDGKKFKYKQLEKLLIETASLSMAEQHRQLDIAFEKWRGSLEQVDDVCLIGIELQ